MPIRMHVDVTVLSTGLNRRGKEKLAVLSVMRPRPV